jgi:RecB family exonuclease
MNFDGYKKRHHGWNYGGQNWKLSRSKIDLFNECPRCFYLDNKLGVRRPGMPSFNLNTAVDTLLKKEFDKYRKEQKPHPLMEEYKIDAVPYQHPELEQWRENFVGVQYYDEATGMTISGAVDDIWVNPKGELIVVDYKSTSKDQEITLDDKWKEGYKRQMEVYQWILRKKGFDVADVGYFVYANATTAPDAFDGKLDFDVTILEHEGDASWIEGKIDQIHEVLNKDEIPQQSGEYCEHCPYHYMRNTEGDNK